MEPLHTLTHARLRAAQGDLRGARRLLLGILDADPSRDDARNLLDSLGTGAQTGHQEPAPRPLAPPVATTAGELVDRFRVELGGARPTARAARVRRLRHWLEGVERNAPPAD